MTAKADRASELVNDPILKEAFTTLREKYRDLIETTPLDSKQTDALHDVRKMLYLLRQVEAHLNTVIQGGHLEDFNVQEQRGILGDLKWLKRA